MEQSAAIIIVRFPTPTPIQGNLERSHRLSFFVREHRQELTLRSIPSVQGVPPEADRLRELLRKRSNHFCSLSRRWHREYILQLRTANLDNAGRPRPLRHPGLDGRV